MLPKRGGSHGQRFFFIEESHRTFKITLMIGCELQADTRTECTVHPSLPAVHPWPEYFLIPATPIRRATQVHHCSRQSGVLSPR